MSNKVKRKPRRPARRGRPAAIENSCVISLRVGSDVKQLLEVHARASRCSLSELLRESLALWLDRKGSPCA